MENPVYLNLNLHCEIVLNLTIEIGSTKFLDIQPLFIGNFSQAGVLGRNPHEIFDDFNCSKIKSTLLKSFYELKSVVPNSKIFSHIILQKFELGSGLWGRRPQIIFDDFNCSEIKSTLLKSFNDSF